MTEDADRQFLETLFAALYKAAQDKEAVFTLERTTYKPAFSYFISASPSSAADDFRPSVIGALERMGARFHTRGSSMKGFMTIGEQSEESLEANAAKFHAQVEFIRENLDKLPLSAEARETLIGRAGAEMDSGIERRRPSHAHRVPPPKESYATAAAEKRNSFLEL